MLAAFNDNKRVFSPLGSDPHRDYRCLDGQKDKYEFPIFTSGNIRIILLLFSRPQWNFHH